MTKIETMDKMNTNIVVLTDLDLMDINGGANLLSDIGGFIGNAWNTLYNSGRDLGRSIVNSYHIDFLYRKRIAQK